MGKKKKSLRTREYKHREVTREDYGKAMRRAVERLKEPENKSMSDGKLERKLIDVSKRLKAQMLVAGLMRRKFTMTNIAEVIGVEDEGTIGRYLDGKMAPEPPVAKILEHMYTEHRKKKAKPLTGIIEDIK